MSESRKWIYRTYLRRGRSGDQLSPKKFFSRLGLLSFESLISFLDLGGHSAWENLRYIQTIIYLEKCKTKLESEGVDVNYLISQTPIIRDNLQKYNEAVFIDYRLQARPKP